VRRLEGALMRVASFASLSGKELTNEVVEHLLKDILNEEARHASRSSRSNARWPSTSTSASRT
jgi:chromosomal replication initiation ATPase DnaA